MQRNRHLASKLNSCMFCGRQRIPRATALRKHVAGRCGAVPAGLSRCQRSYRNATRPPSLVHVQRGWPSMPCRQATYSMTAMRSTDSGSAS